MNFLANHKSYFSKIPLKDRETTSSENHLKPFRKINLFFDTTAEKKQ